MLKYTAIWNKTKFSKADNYMKEGCFQSPSSCGKYPYIWDLYLQKNGCCFKIYEILRLSFWLKPSLMLYFLAFHWQSRFCVNEYIANIHTKIICNIFFWSLQSSFARNKADFEISIFNLTHKVPPNTSFEIGKPLKRMPSLAYTEMDQTKYRVSLMFASGCIIWT